MSSCIGGSSFFPAFGEGTKLLGFETRLVSLANGYRNVGRTKAIGVSVVFFTTVLALG
ncbi:MAG: hypothetical protein AAB250_07130 [Bdellovibrionota bacterium]